MHTLGYRSKGIGTNMHGNTPATTAATSHTPREKTEMISSDFEVFGKVQGVWFRKYTMQEAIRLGVVGYCQNTSQGTVKGRVQGPQPSMHIMKEWLQTTGSPLSRIDRCIFSHESTIPSLEYSTFDILRDTRSSD